MNMENANVMTRWHFLYTLFIGTENVKVSKMQICQFLFNGIISVHLQKRK